MSKPTKKKASAPNPWLYSCALDTPVGDIIAALRAPCPCWVAEVNALASECADDEGAFFAVVHALGYKDPRRVRPEDLHNPMGYAGFLFYTPFDLVRRSEERIDDDEVIIIRNSAVFAPSRLARLIHRLMGRGLERLAARVPRGTVVYDLAGRPSTTRSIVLEGWESPTVEAHGLGERLALMVNPLPPTLPYTDDMLDAPQT